MGLVLKLERVVVVFNWFVFCVNGYYLVGVNRILFMFYVIENFFSFFIILIFVREEDFFEVFSLWSRVG